MASVEEFVNADWSYKIPDPADGGAPKTAAQMLGWARADAYAANVNTVALLNEVRALAALVATLVPPE